MNDETLRHDVTPGDGHQWEPVGDPATGSTPEVEPPAPHSRLVGFMGEPLARTVPFRRSTVAMLVAFLGLGALTYLYPPDGPAPTGTSTTSGGVPGIFVPSPSTTTTTTTGPPATTTTQPSATTTTVGGSTATTAGAGPTTTTTSRPAGSTTTSTSTTTTSPPGSSTSTTSIP